MNGSKIRKVVVLVMIKCLSHLNRDQMLMLLPSNGLLPPNGNFLQDNASTNGCLACCLARSPVDKLVSW